ncbi:kinesin-domain-containing protein [Ramicandelaber brevisporus]|nr:kinesin-domain-containing protein [Ramicandelaber brevisporus]
MTGINGTIFAYGMTASGKTHTQYGSKKEPGIIPKAIERIFDIIDQTPDRVFMLSVSFMEIYNECIRDLLADPQKPNRDVYVDGLSEIIVTSPADILHHLATGERNRHVGETDMNARSSRSHTIFRINIETPVMPSSVRQSCLNLVDLAGSERAKDTGAEGERLKEGAHINKSLLTLAAVIGKLADERNSATAGAGGGGGGYVHIPYRDSKLTRILQTSLGGNARTAVICTITPSPLYISESMSTLHFASNAGRVCNKPQINEKLGWSRETPKYEHKYKCHSW